MTVPSSQASKDPEVFLTQLNEAIDYVSDAIGQYLEDMATAITEHASEGGAFIGFVLGGPIGGLLGWGAGNEIEEAFDDACNDINEAWAEAVTSIRQTVGSMFGDPLMMSQIASDYRDAVREIGTVTNHISSMNGTLRSSWTGRAWNAYAFGVCPQQDAALKGMSDMLVNAADLLDDNSLNLVKYWSSQLKNIIDLAGKFIDKTGDLGDAGNWFSLGAGVAMDMIASTVSAVASILDTYVSYWATLNIGSAGDWDGLDSQFGVKGMPGEKWPKIDAINLGPMNGPWQAA